MTSRTHWLLVCIVTLALPAPWARAQQPDIELLWPDRAPAAKGDTDNDKPSLSIFLPPEEKAAGSAIVICPGGGYGHLSMVKEGSDVALWLNSLGVSAFVLKYRHAANGYRHPVPLEDAQRAMRVVRANSDKWRLDSSRVGLMGFSAGGHLASTVGTHFDRGRPEDDDPVERISCRPDFLVLCYPVITLSGPYVHQGSKKNLLGDKPEAELVQGLSNELQVTPETPPTFLFSTSADTAVPPENSVMFYLALKRSKVPAELHIYQEGPHGVGLAPKDAVLTTWKERLADWLKVRGVLEKH